MSASVDLVAAYVPALLRAQLERAPTIADARAELEAVVMVADISGFTALSEDLASRGATGPEELSGVLNSTFGALIELVHRYGGDVVKFAGDALVAAWPGAGDRRRRAALLSASLAVALPMTLRRPSVGSSPLPQINLRLGVAVGPLVLAPVGGELGRWELLVAGAAVAEAAEAQKHAPPGGAAFTEEAWRALGNAADGEPLGRGFVCLKRLRGEAPTAPSPMGPAAPSLESGLRGFVPGVILRRLDAGLTAWVAELRQVSAIFVRLPGLSVNDPPPTPALQAVARVIQGCLYRTEGVLDKITVDEKGLSVLAGFGLPPFAHEDDALRAVRAALAIRDGLAEEGQAASVGLATGKVFCGTLGGPDRCEYTMLGDTVNRAARLMQVAALGEVLCDGATAEAVGDRVHWEPLHAIQLKGVRGLSVPLRPSAVAPLRVDGVGSGRMIGRDAERELLVASVTHGLAEGSPQAVFVIGARGMGKSRLLAEARDELLTRKACRRVVYATGDAIDQMSPYAVWRTVFAEVLGVRGRAGREALKARLNDTLGPELAPDASLLNAILPLGLPESEGLKGLSPEGRADRTRGVALRLLLASTADEPLILFMDEVQRFDSASWALLEDVVELAPQVHLVVAIAPLTGERAARLERLRTVGRCRTLLLGPLPEADQIALATAVLGGHVLPASLARGLVERAQGNPYYMAELARALRSRDPASARSAWASLEPGSLPGSVEGALASRIDRLEPAEQVVLKVASVFGRPFDNEELRALLPPEQAGVALDRLLVALVDAELLRRDEEEGGSRWTFTSALVREAAYGLMTFSQRRGLHNTLAARLEAVVAAGGSVPRSVLALHWTRAEVPERAVPALVAAGEEAARQFLLDETTRFFRKALLLAPDAPAASRRQWLMHLGVARLRGGWADDAREHLLNALALGGSGPPTSRLGLAWSVLSELARFATSRTQIVRVHDPVRQLESRLWLELGWSEYFRVAPVDTLYATLRAVNTARPLGPTYELGVGCASMSAFCTFAGLETPARRFRSRAVAVIEASAEPSVGGVALEVLGAASLARADWQQAHQELSRARTLDDAAGLLEDRDLTTLLLSQLCRARGDLAGAERHAREALSAGERRGSPMVRVRAALALGTLSLARAEVAPALALLDDAAAAADDAGGIDAASALGARLARSLASLLRGDVVAGRELLLPVIADPRLVAAAASPAGRIGELAMMSLTRACALSTGGDAERCLGALRLVATSLRGRSRAIHLHRPLAWTLAGAARWYAGDRAGAFGAWRRGEAAAGQLGMVWDQALLRATLADQLDLSRQPLLPLPCGPERLVELYALRKGA